MREIEPNPSDLDFTPSMAVGLPESYVCTACGEVFPMGGDGPQRQIVCQDCRPEAEPEAERLTCTCVSCGKEFPRDAGDPVDITCEECYLAEEDAGDPEDDEDAGPSCPACDGPGVHLGGLGTMAYFRCRNCGMDFSRPPEVDDEPAWGPVTTCLKCGEQFQRKVTELGAMCSECEALTFYRQ